MSRHTEPLTYRVSADQMRVHIECNGVLVATAYTIPDARLYAAAPKLLAALERLADNAEGRNLRGQSPETALRQAIAEARDVIAESRGGK